MIPVEQYERYLWKIKKKMDSREESEIMNDNIPDDFSEETESDDDDKSLFTPKKSLKSKKNSTIIPPPGLSESLDIQQKHNEQQIGEGSRGKGSKPEWLQKWERKF